MAACRVPSRAVSRVAKRVLQRTSALDEQHRAAITVAAIGMWSTHINAVKQNLPNAKIAFDHFHIAKPLALR